MRLTVDTIVSVLLDSLATTNISLQDKWNEMIGAKEMDLSYSIAAGVVDQVAQLDNNAIYDKDTITKILAAANPAGASSKAGDKTPLGGTPVKQTLNSSASTDVVKSSGSSPGSLSSSSTSTSTTTSAAAATTTTTSTSATTTTPAAAVATTTTTSTAVGGATKTKIKVKKSHAASSPELEPLTSPEQV
jgi:hypothetical protein